MDIKPNPNQQNQNINMQSPGNFVRPPSPQTAAPQVTPIQTSNVKHAHKFIFGYVGLVLLAAAVGGVYYWQHGLLSTANDTIATQNTEITSLKKSVSTLTADNKKLNSKNVIIQPAQANGALTTLKLPDLGISINNVPSTLDALNDSYSATTLTAVLSTGTLTSADPNCASTKLIGIGSIIKANGTYDSKSMTLKSGQTFVKQFPNFYILSSKPSTTCSTITTVKTLQSSQATILQTLLANPANITAP